MNFKRCGVTLALFIFLFPTSLVLSQPLTEFSIRLVEADGNQWTLSIPHDSIWHHYAYPLSAFGSGAGFLDTPVRTFQVIPVGGISLNGYGVEVAEWLDQIQLGDTLVDNFEQSSLSNWYLNLATNGSYLQTSLDLNVPPSLGHCMKLVHGNSMWATFAGWTEKRYAGIALTPADTLSFWLRGYSYTLTDVGTTGNVLPTTTKLFQNYPNPFNPSTQISYALPIAGRVRLSVLNILGEELEMLADGQQAAGVHRFTWEPQGRPAGLYFLRLQIGNEIRVMKMMLVK
jgi:hypothetical protein